MGLFDKIFGFRPKEKGAYQGFFKMLNGYEPRFTSWGGGVYESELIRSAIDARATHISKLKVEVKGAARPALQTKLRPGIYTPLPSKCEVVQYNGTPYLRYEFGWGEHAAVELSYCGLMVKHQYKNDFFGENNQALLPTLDLIHIQNQGIQEGVKSAATYRFMAQVANFSKPEDLAKERKRFTAENFSKDAEAGGLLLFPNTYKDIKQVEVKPWVVDADQMKIINESVYRYFGVNEDVLQNKAYGDAWAAFYEGAVEPFAIQFSEVLTKMLFTFREQSQGAGVMATANRLQYMSNADKLNVAAQMADRGLMTRNEIREIFNLPPLDDSIGSQLPVRGEYYNVGEDKPSSDDTEGGTEDAE